MLLSPKQINSFSEATRRFNIWVGAVRSGKTYASVRVLIKFLQGGVPGDVMIVGVSLETIHRNVLKQLYALLGFPPPSPKTNQTTLYNRTVYFVGANDTGAVRRIQGSTLACAYVDEMTCIPETVFKILQSRLSERGAQLFATCNPESPSHWVKKNYIDKANEIDLVYWHFVLDDNPSLDDSYKKNIAREYQGTHWYKRLIMGEWSAATGAVFDGFDQDNIFSDEKEAPDYYIAAIDYGTINATCCLLAAISPKRWPHIRVEEEYYYDSQVRGRTKTDAELADDITKFLSWRSIRALYLDPSAASLKTELRSKNLPVLDAKNDVLNGIQVVNKFIYGKNLIVHSKCKNLIEQLHSYQWDPKSINSGVDKPLKENDHAVDCLRYLCFSAFPQGQLSHPDDNLTIEQIRRYVYGEEINILGNYQHFG